MRDESTSSETQLNVDMESERATPNPNAATFIETSLPQEPPTSIKQVELDPVWSLPPLGVEDIKLCFQAKTLAEAIKVAIDEKQEPLELLGQLDSLLYHEHQMILHELVSLQSSDRSSFYISVFKGLCDKFLQLKTAASHPFLSQIFKFFRIILVNFYYADPASESLTETVHSIFNSECPLYSTQTQHGYQQHLNQTQINYETVSDEDLTVNQRRVKEEWAWRKQLVPGSRIDAVSAVTVVNRKMSQWMKATVVQISNDGNLQVTFDNLSNRLNRELPLDSLEISMPDTFTDDLEWKMQLQENDEIDAMDAEHVWYRSTVLRTKIVKDTFVNIVNGEALPHKDLKEAYVGFRVYTEEGHKWDDEGRKFLGWSNRYDVWINLYEPTIQKHRTMVKQYKQVGKDFMIYDVNSVYDDITDTLENTKVRKIYAVNRDKYFLGLRNLPDFLNEFGQKGGFERILSTLVYQRENLTMKQVYQTVDIISKILPFVQRQFACYFIPTFVEAVQQCLFSSYSSDTSKSPLVKHYHKESVVGLPKSLLTIMRRHYTVFEYSTLQAIINFEIGFTLLKAERLDHRIQGIKEVIEQIKNTKYSSKKTLKSSEVMEKLKQNKILETIFGDNYHVQIVQRSSDIIKFFIQEGEINEAQIDIIWRATQKDQQTKLEIYKILQECALQLKQDKVLVFVRKFKQIPPEDFIEREIDCLYELSKYVFKESFCALEAAQLLWDIAVRERPYRKQLIELAMDKFIDLQRNFEREQKYQYIRNCVNKLRQGTASIQCIKMIQQILSQIPTYRIQNHLTQYEVANDLIKSDDIINLVIFDLVQYSEQVNELWAKKAIVEQTVESTDILDLPFTHRSQSYTRLNFIKNILQNSQTQLEEIQLDQIWDLFLVRSKVSIDADIFFDWLKTLLSDQNKLSPQLIRHFFESKVCSKQNDVNFQFLKKSGFDCIKSMFLRINEEEDKILVIVNPGMGSNTLNQKLEFKVHVPPNELLGIDVLWRLLSECDKKNSDLVSLIVELITKVYHSLSSDLEKEKHQIEDQFCRSTLDRVARVVDNAEISDNDKRNFIKSCTVMLKSFFADSERNGCGDMRPFYATEKNVFVENLIIQNAITAHKNCPKYIQISVHSNLTIWQLKQLIGQKLKINPLKIQLIRPDSKKKVIADTDNCEIIRKFMFEQYEMINAQKKPYISQSRVPLLNKQKQLVPQAQAIFTTWFEKFSKDGWMTPTSCTEFIRSSTQDQTVLETDPRIVRLFNTYDEDCDGKLSLEGFLQFYTDSCREKLDLVWSNLKTHKIGNDLKPIPPQENLEDPFEIKDPSVLPRFVLSQDQQVFDSLFQLFPKLSPFAQNDLREFISMLRINPLVYSKILSLSGLSELLEEESLEKILYNLEILSVLLQQQSTQREPQIKSYFYENQDPKAEFPSLQESFQEKQVNDKIMEEREEHTFIGDARDKSSAAPSSGHVQREQRQPNVSVHESNQPIALPGPVMVGQGAHIPDAPLMMNGPTYGPSLPPIQNSGSAVSQAVGVSTNNFRNKDMLENFKGHIITETYSDAVIPDEEVAMYLGVTDLATVKELQQSFIQSFVTNNGFKILLKLMHKVVALAKSQHQDKLFENRAHKESLQFLIKFLRTFLLSSFIGNSNNDILTIELRKQMSAQASKKSELGVGTLPLMEADFFIENDLEKQLFDSQPAQTQTAANGASLPAKEEKKNKMQTDQDDFEKEHEPLISILRGDLGNTIIQSVDFVDLQNEIFETLFLLFKKSTLIATDFENVQSIVQLWITIVLFNHSLLQQIITDYYHHRQQASEGQSSTLDLIIMNGLLSKDNKAKSAMEDALKFLFINLKVKVEEVHEPPYLFLLKVLINNSKLTDNQPNHSKQYFGLMASLFQSYFESKNKEDRDTQFQEIFDSKTILDEFIVKMETYQAQETKKRQFYTDYNQNGYMSIIEVIIRNEPHLLSLEESRHLASYLLQSCLFCQDIPPMDSHFLKGTNVEAHEKPFINKCLSGLTRETAYNLLKRVCLNSPELVPELMVSQMSQYLQTVSKPRRNQYNPRTEGRSFHNYCGIRNLGSICYMNSMIQQFFHIPAFRYCLMSTQDNQPLNLQTFENRQVNDNMLFQLIKFMGSLELSERQDYDPRDFCFSFKDFAGQPTNVRIQQDTQEFLNLAFDRIERLLAPTSQKYLLNNIFQGSTSSLMICKNCGNLRQNTDNFYNLSLEVKNQKTIHDALKKFITGEIINDFKCEACNQKVDIERRSVLEKLPNMLMVHLQRIIFDFDTFQNVKLNTRLEFPSVLNLKPYMLSEVMKQEQEMLKKAKKSQKKLEKQRLKEALLREQEAQKQSEEGKDDEEQDKSNNTPSKSQQPVEEDSSDDEEMEIDTETPQQDLADEDCEYKLVGVVVHMGTAQAGHYVSYINISRGEKSEENPEWLQTEKDKWLEFNDSQVKMYMFHRLEQDCFGGIMQGGMGVVDSQSDYDYTKNAYMLIYEKRRKEKIRIVVPPEIARSLDCDGTAMPRAALPENDFFLQVVPQAKELLARGDQVLFDQEKNEHYLLVDFNSAQQFVPHEIYREVHQDNLLFLKEKQILSNDFFGFMRSLYEQLLDSQPLIFAPESQAAPTLFAMLQRMLFELLPFTSENTHYKPLYQLFLRALSLNTIILKEFIDTKILVDKATLEKDERTFIENMVQNIDSEKRETNKNTLLFVVNTLFAMGQIDKVDDILQPIFAMIPDEFSKNWLKIGQVLGLIFEITKSGPAQQAYMVRNGIVSKLIDLFMEQESPKNVHKTRQPMGSNYATPQLDNLILTISWIVRHYPNIRMPESEENPIKEITEKARQYPSLQYMNNSGVEFPPLSEDDLFMLSQKKFYNRNLKVGYERIEFSRLIAHLSFLNYDFSKKVSKVILVGINKINSDEAEPLLMALSAVVTLVDPLASMRLAWLLGVPSLKVDFKQDYKRGQTNYSFKLGVSLLDNATDEVFEYKTPLFKSQQTIRESLMQLLYSQRRKYSKLVIRGLLHLLEYVQNSLILQQYLRTLEPPSYVYGRYIDWILPFLEDQLSYVRGNTQQQQMERLAIQSMIDKFNLVFVAPYANLQPVVPEGQATLSQDAPQANNQGGVVQPPKKRQPFNYSSVDGGPDQYMIWNVVQEKIADEKILLEDNVKLTVKELLVLATGSKPDGRYNQVFTPNQFNSYAASNNRGGSSYNNKSGLEEDKQDRSMSNSKKHRNYGRGKNPIPGIHQESGTYQAQEMNDKFTVLKPTRHREDHQHHNNEQLSDPNPNEQSYGEYSQGNPQLDSGYQQDYQDNDGNKQKSQDDNSMEVEYSNDNQQDQSEFFQDAADTELKPQDPQDILLQDLDYQQEPAGAEINDAVVDRQEEEHIEGDYEAKGYQRIDLENGESGASQNNFQDDNQMMNDDFQEEQPVSQYGDPDIWEAEVPCVLMFTVQNLDVMNAVTVKLTLRDASKPGEPQYHGLNFKNPQSPIYATILGGRTRDILILTKLRPFDFWGIYEVQFEVKKPKQRPLQNEEAVVLPMQEISASNNQQMGMSDADVNYFPSEDNPSEIPCPACTFLNLSIMSMCEVCGSNLK